jgi:hypothetical protein
MSISAVILCFEVWFQAFEVRCILSFEALFEVSFEVFNPGI